ncbi:MAG: AbrB/MazE/SpoVT family DNA-binding domain-containing protein [Burkholderiales bacterium]|nr:AbrB/MazE/SpoVT family DNA-binding domain-containing protein [Burkholderiales bacterium]
MSKVTGKFQLTLPKRLVDAYGIRVGDEVELLAAGDSITLVPPGRARNVATVEERLRYFDRATDRQRKREGTRALRPARDRGWSREELYAHDRSR